MLKLQSAGQQIHTDRRQSPRYRLRNGALALNSTIIGPILDLSLHGMSFEYFAEDLDGIDHTDMGIFISTSRLLVTGLQTRTVRDRVIANNSSFLSSIRKTRAVEFIDPSGEQLRRIGRIIAHQTSGHHHKTAVPLCPLPLY